MVIKLTTKEVLFESFKELAQEKKLEDISINNIVENGHISRATFYRYFKDKFDLMEQYYQLNNLGKYEGQNNIFDIIYVYCVNLHIRQAKKYYQNDKIPEELLFAIYYHASGGVAMMKKIIINKELELSEEQYTNYYKNCMSMILKKIYV